jgi:hypothetical protein
MAIRERNCKRCNFVFTPLVSRRLYCSTDCRQEEYDDYRATLRKLGKATETINCRHCATPFQRTNYAVWHCSGACSVAARKARAINATRKWRVTQFEKVRPGGLVVCKRCAVEFTTKSLRQIYCGDECYRRRRSTYVIAPVVEVDDEPATLTVIACELTECGKDFQQTQAHQRYCCILHRRRHTRRTSYRAELGKAPIMSGSASLAERKETMREAMAHLQQVKGHGFEYSGYSESSPREVTSTLTSCPHCRAYGTDTLGRVQHSSWCREAVAP